MAHKKGEGSVKNGRDSQAKRLGVKIFGAKLQLQATLLFAKEVHNTTPGKNVGLGKDFTIFAMTDGLVEFRKTKGDKTFVSVAAIEATA